MSSSSSQWVERCRKAIAASALLSLIAFGALGALVFLMRKPEPAPIVIHAITPPVPQAQLPTATPGPIQVYVSGAVARPGVYAIPWDSRVVQAIIASGGALAEADLVRVNLAQRVYDEQQIYVPYKEEVATPVLPTVAPRVLSSEMMSGSGQKVNINTASVNELEKLPGIGLTLAQRIVDHRQSNGPFQRPEDIKKVKGIGDSIFTQIKELITVE